jgi:hypothetical protein
MTVTHGFSDLEGKVAFPRHYEQRNLHVHDIHR